MTQHLTNLLPPDRKKKLRRAYYVRLATLIILAIGFLAISAALLQSPLLLYSIQRTQTLERETIMLESTVKSSGGDLGIRLKSLDENLSYLFRLSQVQTAADIISKLTNVPHEGIHLSNISYTAPSKSVERKIVVMGTAATRQTLQAYVRSLSDALGVSADLPISEYAKDSDLPFAITLTGTF